MYRYYDNIYTLYSNGSHLFHYNVYYCIRIPELGYFYPVFSIRSHAVVHWYTILFLNRIRK